MLAALPLEDLIPATHVFGTKSGTELDRKALAAGRRFGVFRMAESDHLYAARFPPGRGTAHQERVADNYTARGAEVKSRLVSTEVAYGRRDTCFAGTHPMKALRLVVSLAASRGKRLVFFDVVAAFVHALIDEFARAAQQCCKKLSRALARHQSCGSSSCVTCWTMQDGKRR